MLWTASSVPPYSKNRINPVTRNECGEQTGQIGINCTAPNHRVSPTKVRKVPQDSCQLPGRKGFRRFRNSQDETCFSRSVLGAWFRPNPEACPPRNHTLSECLTSRGLSDAQIQLISGHESKKSLEVSTNTCHSNRSIRRTRMRSRVGGSKKIAVGLYVPLLG